MDEPELSRRDFLGRGAAGLAAGGLAAGGVATGGAPATAGRVAPAKRLHVVCVGAHPDDPESGCGGTLARYAEAGHDVTVVYLTRGEAGIAGKSHEFAATTRTGEAEAACRILGARALFAGQVDGATEVSPARTRDFARLLAATKPD